MELEKAKEIVKSKYEIQKYSPEIFYIITDYMYNESSIVTVTFFEKDGETYISDYGGAYKHSTMKRERPKLVFPEGQELEELDVLAANYSFIFDGASFVKKFEKIEDIDALLELIGEVAGEEDEEE